MATIIDVAKRADVSTMTVSRVINNSGSVSEKTLARVTEAIKELGYIPNATARSLVTKTNRSIGILIATVQNPYYGRVMLGVENVAENQGYSVLLFNAKQQEKYDDYVESIISQGVSGIIASHLNLQERHIAKLTEYGVRCVLVDNEQDIDQVYSICSDHYYGAVEAVKHLLALGHRRIGFMHSDILSPEDTRAIEAGRPVSHIDVTRKGYESSYSVRLWADRYRGYIDTMRAHGCPIDPALILGGDAWFENNVRSGMACMARFLQQKDPPTAIYAGNDLFGIGALNEAQKNRVSVPEALSIIGHGGIDATKYTWPVLTSMKQPRFEIGATAARTLLWLIQHGQDAPEKPPFPLVQIMRPTLVSGNSTASCSQ